MNLARSRGRMPRGDSSAGCVVEQERLLALVDTQRRHIDELRKQLRDTLVSASKRASGPSVHTAEALLVCQPHVATPLTAAFLGEMASCSRPLSSMSVATHRKSRGNSSCS